MAFQAKERYFMFGQGFELELDTENTIIEVFNVYNPTELNNLTEKIKEEDTETKEKMQELIKRSPMVALQTTNGTKRVAMTAVKMFIGHTRLIASGFVILKDI